MPYKNAADKAAADRRYHSKCRAFVTEMRENGHCLDCGEDDTVVLQFHHRDPAEKEGRLGERLSMPQLLRELEKCVLVCANCHLRRHARASG